MFKSALLMLVLFATACSSSASTVDASGLANGVLFEDPDGSYSVVVSSEWPTAHGGFAAGIEMWQVVGDVDGFNPNVNILTQVVASDLQLDEYMRLSIEGAPSLIEGFENISLENVTGPNGQTLARWEYAGSVVGTQLHFLAVIGMGQGEAVVATYTTLPELFDGSIAEIEPYMLTLLPRS